MSDYISREDALLCATGEYADDSFEDSIREAECKKIAKRLKELKPFVEIPKGMTNGEVMNLILRKTFPRMIFIRGINEWNKTKSIVYAEEWENAPYKAEKPETCKGCLEPCIMYEPDMRGCKKKVREVSK